MRYVLRESADTIRKSANSADAVFISHQRNDKDAAEAVAKYLENRGLTPWLAVRDPGAQAAHASGDDATLTAKIVAAIQACPQMLVVISRVGLGSEWIPFEVGAALALESKAVGLVLLPDVDGAALPEYFSLTTQIRSKDDLEMWFRGLRLQKGSSLALAEALRGAEAAGVALAVRRHLDRRPPLYIRKGR